MLENLVRFTDPSAIQLASANADAFESPPCMIYPAGAYWSRALITTSPLKSKFVLPMHLDDALFALRSHPLEAVFVDPKVRDADLDAMRSVIRTRQLPCPIVGIEDSMQRERIVWMLQQRLIDRAVVVPFRPRLLQALLNPARSRDAPERVATNESVLLLAADSDLVDSVNETLPDIAVIECSSAPAFKAHLRNTNIRAVMIDIETDESALMQAIAIARHASSTLRMIGLRRVADTGRDAYLLGREGFNRIVTMPAGTESLRAACLGRRYEPGAFLSSAR